MKTVNGGHTKKGYTLKEMRAEEMLGYMEALKDVSCALRNEYAAAVRRKPASMITERDLFMALAHARMAVRIDRVSELMRDDFESMFGYDPSRRVLGMEFPDGSPDVFQILMRAPAEKRLSGNGEKKKTDGNVPVGNDSHDGEGEVF